MNPRCGCNEPGISDSDSDSDSLRQDVRRTSPWCGPQVPKTLRILLSRPELRCVLARPTLSGACHVCMNDVEAASQASDLGLAWCLCKPWHVGVGSGPSPNPGPISNNSQTTSPPCQWQTIKMCCAAASVMSLGSALRGAINHAD